jgi:polyhydroxybutyrate depolymerase
MRPFVPAVAEATSTWVAHNGCAPKAKKTQQGKVIKELYTGGKAGTEVAVYTIVGGGHDWPGARNDKTGSGFRTTDVVWEFFKKHPKK